MRFTITVDHENKLVRITHPEEMTLDDMLPARAEAGRRLRDNDFTRLLVDVTLLENAPPVMDAFEISSSHHRDLESEVRLAILTSRRLEADARFSENVASNRGMKVRVFTDETAALAWLQMD